MENCASVQTNVDIKQEPEILTWDWTSKNNMPGVIDFSPATCFDLFIRLSNGDPKNIIHCESIYKKTKCWHGNSKCQRKLFKLLLLPRKDFAHPFFVSPEWEYQHVTKRQILDGKPIWRLDLDWTKTCVAIILKACCQKADMLGMWRCKHKVALTPGRATLLMSSASASVTKPW